MFIQPSRNIVIQSINKYRVDLLLQIIYNKINILLTQYIQDINDNVEFQYFFGNSITCN